MKTYLAGLQNSIQTTYSNNGKTTLLGRAFQKTLNTQSVIGPALTQFIDVNTICGVAPTYSYFNPTTNHLFVLGAAAANTVVALFNFNNSTGVYSYVGKISMWLANAAATTPTYRGFAVYETGGQINIIVSDTGTVAINGGTYVAHGLTTADFTPGGSQIFSASTSNQKAVYFLQDPAALGVAHVASTSWGCSLPQLSTNVALNSKVWQWNGTLAAPVLYSWDLSQTPVVAGTLLNGVSAQTTLYTGTSPSAFFTMGSSNNGYANNDPVVITGNVPTAFTAWVSNTTQVAASNVYFVRDLQLVSGSYYFNLSSTSGGAAITPTSSTSSFTMMRAFGTCSNIFNCKTGTLPAFSGTTILQNNSVGYCSPTSAPANTSLNGQDCLYMLNQSLLFMGKITDLNPQYTFTVTSANATSGAVYSNNNNYFTVTSTISGGVTLVTSGTGVATSSGTLTKVSGTGDATITFSSVATVNVTSWLSMNFTGINATGTGVDITTPTVLMGAYSSEVDRFVYVTNASTYVMKPYQNSVITTVFGNQANNYYEAQNMTTIQSGLVAIGGFNIMGGWLFSCGTTTGQRGIVFLDLYSEGIFGNTGIISPVLNVPNGTIFNFASTVEQYFDFTDSVNLWIRSASTSSDAAFNSSALPVGYVSTSGVVSNGWTSIKGFANLSSISIGPYFQLCATFEVANLVANTPPQINDLIYTVTPPNEISNYWQGSVDNTSDNGESPAYSAFRLVQVYPSSVPTLYFRAYDDSGNLVASGNTVTNASSFSYTTNNGTSWNSLGTIPNTAGTTEVRWTWATPPGVRVTVSIRES